MSGSSRCEIALVGGGLVGACLAEELAAHGGDVLVLDAGTDPGHATGKAAGVAVPSLRYLPDEAFFSWLVAARADLEQDLTRLERKHGPLGLARPVLRLLGEEDLEQLPEGEHASALGAPATGEDLARLAPALRVPDDRKVFLAPDGLTVDGRGYLQAVRDEAMRAGAVWHQGQVVGLIEESENGVTLSCTDGSTVNAERVVVTAGAWTGQLVDVPVRPQRGQLLLLDAPDLGLDSIVSGRLYLAPLPGGGLLVGATEEDAGFDERSTIGTLAGMLAFALRLIPDLVPASLVEARSGLRPVSTTGRPVVGRAPGYRKVYVSAGHAGHGLISARATARGMLAGLEFGDWSGLPEDFCPRESVPLAGHSGVPGKG